MKGVLIGFYYTLRFGLVGLFLLAEYHAYDKYYPAHHYVLNCATAHYLEITVVGLLSSYVHSCSYCLLVATSSGREMKLSMCISFAEEYYTKL